jgi:uroporphyrinogen decarboxylase
MYSKRQRVIDTINHKKTDLIPWQMDLTRDLEALIKTQIGCKDPSIFLGNHLFVLKYRNSKNMGQNTYKDLFGINWLKSNDGGSIGVPIENVIKDSNLNKYPFPKIDKELAILLAKKLERDNSNRFRMFGILFCFFERAWTLRGMENLLIDMIEEKAFAHELFDKILEYNMELLNVVLDFNFEGVYLTDDWGQQHGMIMSPNMWREYIKPGMKLMFEKIKNKGKYIILHSCGDITKIFPELIEIGADVYNSVQPEIYNLEWLKKEFGKYITFYGGMSVQQFLTFSNIKKVSEVSKLTLQILGKDSGYIFAPTHTMTPDIPIENVLTMVEVVKKFQYYN